MKSIHSQIKVIYSAKVSKIVLTIVKMIMNLATPGSPDIQALASSLGSAWPSLALFGLARLGVDRFRPEQGWGRRRKAGEGQKVDFIM